jgi:hypothetical protein
MPGSESDMRATTHRPLRWEKAEGRTGRYPGRGLVAITQSIAPGRCAALFAALRRDSDIVGWLSIVHRRASLQLIGISHIVKLGLCACMGVDCAACLAVATMLGSTAELGFPNA